MNASYAASNPANIELWTASFDQDIVDRVRKMEGVQDAEARRVINVRLRTGRDEWITLEMFAVRDFGKIRINQLEPLRGNAQPADREVILSSRSGNSEYPDALLKWPACSRITTVAFTSSAKPFATCTGT